MKKIEICNRRRFLKRLILSGIGGAAVGPALARHAVAMGTLKYPDGIQRIQGQVTIDDPAIREEVQTTQHEHPRYIFGPGQGERIRVAPMIHHKDAELVMLESIVGRKPPFGEMKYY